MPTYGGAGVCAYLAACDLPKSLGPVGTTAANDAHEAIQKALWDAPRMTETRLGLRDTKDNQTVHFLGKLCHLPFILAKATTKGSSTASTAHQYELSSTKRATRSSFQHAGVQLSFSKSANPSKSIVVAGQQTAEPRAVAVHICLQPSNVTDQGSQDEGSAFKVEVFFNGDLAQTVCAEIPPSFQGKDEIRFTLSGTRAAAKTEYPWVLARSGHEADGTKRDVSAYTTASHNWDGIAKTLLAEANARGYNHRDERSPTGYYLECLASLPLPKSVRMMMEDNEQHFGVIDVVVSIGQYEVLRGADPITEPTRCIDGRFQPLSKSDVAAVTLNAPRSTVGMLRPAKSSTTLAQKGPSKQRPQKRSPLAPVQFHPGDPAPASAMGSRAEAARGHPLFNLVSDQEYTVGQPRGSEPLRLKISGRPLSKLAATEDLESRGSGSGETRSIHVHVDPPGPVLPVRASQEAQKLRENLLSPSQTRNAMRVGPFQGYHPILAAITEQMPGGNGLGDATSMPGRAHPPALVAYTSAASIGHTPHKGYEHHGLSKLTSGIKRTHDGDESGGTQPAHGGSNGPGSVAPINASSTGQSHQKGQSASGAVPAREPLSLRCDLQHVAKPVSLTKGSTAGGTGTPSPSADAAQTVSSGGENPPQPEFGTPPASEAPAHSGPMSSSPTKRRRLSDSTPRHSEKWVPGRWENVPTWTERFPEAANYIPEQSQDCALTFALLIEGAVAEHANANGGKVLRRAKAQHPTRFTEREVVAGFRFVVPP